MNRYVEPSGDLIAAVLQFSDLSVDIGHGRTCMSLSPLRRVDPLVKHAVGHEVNRLADIGVVWDECEDEIWRVLDRARGDVVPIPNPGSTTR